MMEAHHKEVESLLNSITIAIKQHGSKLLPTQPRPRTFYVLPKLHRLMQLISTKHIHFHLNMTLIDTEQITPVSKSLEVRPIVSCKGTLTEHISGHVYAILQHFLNKIPSFLKDTKDLFLKLNDITQLETTDLFISTMDVNSLHTNIPHSDGVKACRSFLTVNTTDETLINDIPTLVDFIFKQSFCDWRRTVSANQWHSHVEKNGTDIRQYFHVFRRKYIYFFIQYTTHFLFQIYRWHFYDLATRCRYFRNFHRICKHNSSEHKFHTWVLVYCCVILGCNK